MRLEINAQHQLTGSAVVEQRSSPNHSGAFKAGLPDAIIIHYTAGSSREASVRTLMDSTKKVSAHLVVGRDGLISQLVPFNIRAWHAGKSRFGNRSGYNNYSIGIEIDNVGPLTKEGGQYLSWFKKAYPEAEVIKAVHRNEQNERYWQRYTDQQIDLVKRICEQLIKKYKIREILGHEEISPGRKTDPGPAFPLDELRNTLLPQDQTSTTPSNQVTVTASALNIRQGPSATEPKVASALPYGTTLTVLNEQNGWLQVRTDHGIEGWISKKYTRTIT
ncbi:N-acetylmuramoyl-L-alanine amidase [Magnetococcales bacterium HHB-1]